MAQTLTKLADLHAASCFLNSLLREWHEYVICRSVDALCVLIHLTGVEYLQVPLLTYSLLGRHEYTGKFYLKKGSQCTEINFDELVEKNGNEAQCVSAI